MADSSDRYFLKTYGLTRDEYVSLMGITEGEIEAQRARMDAAQSTYKPTRPTAAAMPGERCRDRRRPISRAPKYYPAVSLTRRSKRRGINDKLLERYQYGALLELRYSSDLLRSTASEQDIISELASLEPINDGLIDGCDYFGMPGFSSKRAYAIRRAQA